MQKPWREASYIGYGKPLLARGDSAVGGTKKRPGPLRQNGFRLVSRPPWSCFVPPAHQHSPACLAIEMIIFLVCYCVCVCSAELRKRSNLARTSFSKRSPKWVAAHYHISNRLSKMALTSHGGRRTSQGESADPDTFLEIASDQK